MLKVNLSAKSGGNMFSISGMDWFMSRLVCGIKMFGKVLVMVPGGYKEMSSIFGDQ